VTIQYSQQARIRASQKHAVVQKAKKAVLGGCDQMETGKENEEADLQRDKC